jgi:tetratricopeptide (TPR) repeat protein
MGARIRAVWCLGLFIAGPAAMAAQGEEWVGAECDLKTGHYLVNSGVVHLKAAVESRFQDQRAKRLNDAERVLLQALSSGGQDDNPATWYYLGRYYLLRGDALGADSALARAERLEPGCANDIKKWRRFHWVPVLNAGIAAWQRGELDSAMASFGRANVLYRAEPHAMLYLGQLFANREAPPDSAIKYFRLGIEVAGSDTAFAEQKKQGMFNLARMYHREQRWPEAVAAYKDYLAVYPNDAEATAALASVFSLSGEADSATALYGRVLARAESLPFLDLMQAGAQMYRNASQAEGAAARATYQLAARAFEAALAKNPSYRDGLYNLANVYYQLRDTTRMLPVARRLVVIDPLHRGALQLLAQAFQFTGQGDSALHYLKLSNEGMPADVTVTELQLNEAGASLAGVVTNFHTRASPALTLVFEFLTLGGDVVAADTVAVPGLPPQGTHQFRAKAVGEGIAAYRYRRVP